MTLAFPTKASMAEFVLACKLTQVETNVEEIMLTGIIPEECLQIAFEQYGAFIPNPPDYILP